jgi:undecaprenyl-diphosphatase
MRSSRIWPLIAGIVCALLAVLAFTWYASEVAEGELLAFDSSVREFVHSFASRRLTDVMTAVSYMGKVGTLVILGTVVTAVMLYLRAFRSTAIFLITMAGEIMLEVTLKATYQRARPKPFFDLPPPESFSFPSGHALGSLCFYGILAWIVVRRIQDVRTRTAIAVLTAVFVLMIGLSRVYLGVHYPSDVLAGFVVGLIWTSSVVFTDRYLNSLSVGRSST